MYKAMLVDDGNAHPGCLEPAADRGSDRPEENGAHDPVAHVGELVLSLDPPRILPWDAFWIGRELAEAVGDPWVRLEVLLQPVDIFVFLLLCGNGWLSGF